MRPNSFLPTRRSLVDRLGDHADQRRWQEFFQTYRRLIFNTARRAGLDDSEAEEVVQETVIAVAKNIGQLRYDPVRGSFKGWLLTITRWRIADQFRKRRPHWRPAEDDGTRTAAIDRVPQTASLSLEHAWEQEWQQSLFQSALATVKRQTEPRHFQIFDCYELQQWPAPKVAKELRVNLAQVYLIRHRVLAALKQEVKRLENGERFQS